MLVCFAHVLCCSQEESRQKDVRGSIDYIHSCLATGKRFIIAVMGVFYLFFLTKSELGKRKKRLFWILPIMGITLIAFSVVYLAVIKPLSNMTFDSVYDMLRVDFGRDDVIKYVIYEEFFKKNHILDYPGQSFFQRFSFLFRELFGPINHIVTINI